MGPDTELPQIWVARNSALNAALGKSPNVYQWRINAMQSLLRLSAEEERSITGRQKIHIGISQTESLEVAVVRCHSDDHSEKGLQHLVKISAANLHFPAGIRDPDFRDNSQHL
jgi:hypothetical protein